MGGRSLEIARLGAVIFQNPDPEIFCNYKF
jgi:hypothetical protein